MFKSGKENYDDRVMDQSCAAYLKFMGVEVTEGEGINCPYRPSSDSGSFIVNGSVFYDHARGEGGNVWKLALKMNGDDKRKALESLYKSAGVPFIPNQIIEKTITVREIALQALRKAYDAFRISASTPKYVVDYLDSRKVGDLTRPYFGYIPKGQLASILSEAEIDLTGLRNREDLIILWYFKNGEPVYYCTRDVTTKAFRKASRDNGILAHPIWNGDSLYHDEHVVWGEGMFDCTSLLELGFGVAGEITCNIISEHKPHLLTALRWRAKNHPDWTFTICLDNDQITETGKRPGNEAAERLALWLWGNGVDVRWVKHDPSEDKVDINLLHQTGMGSAVRKMIEGAKYISEILGYDEELCLRNFTRMLSQQDYRGASRLLNLMEKQNNNAKIKTLIEMTHKIPWDWREIYSDQIKEIVLFGSDIYVFFDKQMFGENKQHYEVFKATDFARNMKQFQVNPVLQVGVGDLNLEYRRPTWRVSKGEQTSKNEYNLFEPSALLLQQPRVGAPLPDLWDRLMDNLAGAAEKEWLLNHMATYVQTLEKPRTIPVFVGKQGTGKNTCMELFGKGIGGFMSVDNGLIESQFNSYLMNAVVLLDELANSQRDSNQLKNKLKQLINETQSINAKHRNTISVKLNNYIAISSNEQTSHVPLVIEEGDRRYCIICGGKDLNLDKKMVSWFDYDGLEEQLPDFILYLLSRPIDKNAAGSPLMTEKKQQLADSSQDYKLACVRAFIEEMQETVAAPQTIKLSEFCDNINEKYNPQFRYIPRSVRPILEGLGVKVTISHKQLFVTIKPNEPPKGDDDSSGGTGDGRDPLPMPGGVEPSITPSISPEWADHEGLSMDGEGLEDLFTP